MRVEESGFRDELRILALRECRGKVYRLEGRIIARLTALRSPE